MKCQMSHSPVQQSPQIQQRSLRVLQPQPLRYQWNLLKTLLRAALKQRLALTGVPPRLLPSDMACYVWASMTPVHSCGREADREGTSLAEELRRLDLEDDSGVSTAQNGISRSAEDDGEPPSQVVEADAIVLSGSSRQDGRRWMRWLLQMPGCHCCSSCCGVHAHRCWRGRQHSSEARALPAGPHI
jgi:hypothetical protein